jgi:Fur family transcriptional regulator, ferric uptake regulator
MCIRCDPGIMLEKKNIRRTKNRLLVLDIVSRAGEPVTAAEIIVKAGERAAGPVVNRVTIYRILELLSSSGVLNRLAAPDHVDRYCLAENENHPSHSHFYCHCCGRMDCLERQPAPISILDSGDLQFGRVDDVQVLINGVCRRCLKREESSGGKSRATGGT